MSRTSNADRRAGFQLVELLVSLAVLGLVVSLALAPLLRVTAKNRVRAAAAEVASAMRTAKSFAIAHSANVGLKFRRLPDGAVVWTLYRDGDGDGVLSADIASGVDPEVAPQQRLAHFDRGVGFGFPPGPAPRDPSRPARRLDGLDDPLRFNNSDIAAFDPLGGSTPGSAYVTDGYSELAVVRVLATTGRVRVMVYDRRSESWQ